MRSGRRVMGPVLRFSATASASALVVGVLVLTSTPSQMSGAPGHGGEESALPQGGCYYLLSHAGEVDPSPADDGNEELAYVGNDPDCNGGCCSNPPSSTTTTEGGGGTTTTTEGGGATTTTTTKGGGGEVTTTTKPGGKTGGTTTTTDGSGGGCRTNCSSGGGGGDPDGGEGGNDGSDGGGMSGGGSGSSGSASSEAADDGTDDGTDDGERSRGVSLDGSRDARTVSLTVLPGSPIEMRLGALRSGVLVWTILHGLGALYLLQRRMTFMLVPARRRRRHETDD